MPDTADLRSLFEVYLPSLNVSRETLGRLTVLEELLRKWQSRINLVAKSTLPELRTRHIIDSAQCVALAPSTKRWVDLGSGGGFPGLVIACFIADYPDAQITMIESNGKKVAFLRQVAREAKLPATVIQGRIEIEAPKLTAPEIVTARALAPLDVLFDMTSHWSAGKTVGLFQKGEQYQAEIDKAKIHWNFDFDVFTSAVGEKSRILKTSNLSKSQ
ncbi:MAG: 16S rRNA (guanine(527)-N(7))-methyltransferase RsmG [Pseudomonadota bacterium]